MKITEPQQVIAYTDTGVMIPCALRFECMTNARIQTPLGVTEQRYRKYRVVCEIPWERINVVRFDIIGWPDDVTFAFDVPGMTRADSMAWAARIPMNELPFRRREPHAQA
jgi:hypothetical protein